MGGGICILSCEPPLLPPTLGHAALGGREGDVFIRGGRSLLPSHPPKETNSAVLSVAHCIAMSCDAVEQCPPRPPPQHCLEGSAPPPAGRTPPQSHEGGGGGQPHCGSAKAAARGWGGAQSQHSPPPSQRPPARLSRGGGQAIPPWSPPSSIGHPQCREQPPLPPSPVCVLRQHCDLPAPPTRAADRGPPAPPEGPLLEKKL